MSWLNFFQTTQEQKHTFGRGINAHIAKDEEKLFIQSYEAFEAGDILNAYELFFKSLINYNNDLSNENITYYVEKEKLYFTLYQGCAKIKGHITKEHLYAEAIIVKKSDVNVALKRYILERNYQLTYAKYFSNEEYIMIKLYHDNLTMSPQKVFFPLREIALNADFDKEHIKSEFCNIPLEDIKHLEKLDKKELDIKYHFLQTSITQLDTKITALPSNDNATMQSFLYLNLLFKIDYLLVPKYKISQKLSKTLLDYFSNENTNFEAKNKELKSYTDKLKQLQFEEFSSNFYKAKYTFNPLEKSSFNDVVNFINESLTKVRWYKNNRYLQIIPTIYQYIAFNILYNYGLNPAARELLHLLVEVQNTEYFHSLSYTKLYNSKTNSFSKRLIVNRINTIISNYQDTYRSLESFTEDLNFDSLNEFSNSFYLNFQTLNFEEL